jgi:hypothetical protein
MCEERERERERQRERESRGEDRKGMPWRKEGNVGSVEEGTTLDINNHGNVRKDG